MQRFDVTALRPPTVGLLQHFLRHFAFK